VIREVWRDRSAGGRPILLLLVRGEAATAEKFGKKWLVVAAILQRGGECLVSVNSNRHYSHWVRMEEETKESAATIEGCAHAVWSFFGCSRCSYQRKDICSLVRALSEKPGFHYS
jgi:hypothetical protein